jgi:hypothetical protein
MFQSAMNENQTNLMGDWTKPQLSEGTEANFISNQNVPAQFTARQWKIHLNKKYIRFERLVLLSLFGFALFPLFIFDGDNSFVFC